MRSRFFVTALSWVVMAIVGGLYGVAGTVAHSVMWGPVPVGLIVAGVTCLALLVAIRSLTHDRGAALAAGLGMVGMLVLISGTGPGGSVIVPNTLLSQVWLWVAAGSAVLVVAWPSLSAFTPAPPPQTSAPEGPEPPTAADPPTERRLDP